MKETKILTAGDSSLLIQFGQEISPEINALSTLMIAAEIALVLLADFFQIRQAGTGRKKELPDDRQ